MDEWSCSSRYTYFFFFNDTATTEIYTLSLHDALPIFLEAMACGCPVVTSSRSSMPEVAGEAAQLVDPFSVESIAQGLEARSEEHTSELQSRQYLVCRLLLEKKTRRTTGCPASLVYARA